MTLELNTYDFPTLHFVMILLSSEGWLVISPAAQNELKKHHRLSAHESFSVLSAKVWFMYDILQSAQQGTNSPPLLSREGLNNVVT